MSSIGLHWAALDDDDDDGDGDFRFLYAGCSRNIKQPPRNKKLELFGLDVPGTFDEHILLPYVCIFLPHAPHMLSMPCMFESCTLCERAHTKCTSRAA